MPPKVRSRDFRRAQSNRDRARQPASEQAKRTPKSEAYNRNKRNADKTRFRDWQNW